MTCLEAAIKKKKAPCGAAWSGMSGMSGMKRCNYCGRENESGAAACSECGVAFAIPPIIQTEPPVIRTRELNVARAVLILLVYLGAQIGVGALAGVVGAILAGVQGRAFGEDLQLSVMAPAALLSVWIGGGCMLLAALALAGPQLTDRTPSGGAWVLGPARGMGLGLAVGVGVAAISLGVVALFGPGPDLEELGPLAQMALTPGLTQVIWVIVALGLAPPIEELLFRGVLYGGLHKSLGPGRAALLTTSVFVLFHITEIVYHVPSVFGIVGLAVAALWLRLRARAIGPAIAAHLGYNAVAVLAALLASHLPQ